MHPAGGWPGRLQGAPPRFVWPSPAPARGLRPPVLEPLSPHARRALAPAGARGRAWLGAERGPARLKLGLEPEATAEASASLQAGAPVASVSRALFAVQPGRVATQALRARGGRGLSLPGTLVSGGAGINTSMWCTAAGAGKGASGQRNAAAFVSLIAAAPPPPPSPAHPSPPLNPLPPPPRSCCLPSLWLLRSGRACASGCRLSATAMSARATAYSGELGGRRQGRGVEAHVACGARGAQARHRAGCCRVCSMAGGRDMPQQQHALNPSSLPSRRRHRAGASCAAAAARSAGRGRWHTTSPAPCAWEGATPDAPRAAGECGRGRYLPTSGRAAGALACGLACACAVFGEPAAAQLPTSLGGLRSGAGIRPSSARFLCTAGTSARAPCSCTSTRRATRS